METKTTDLAEMPALNPIVEALPEMAAAPFASLVEDVRTNGPREAITLDAEGRVIDGRPRLREAAVWTPLAVEDVAKARANGA